MIERGACRKRSRLQRQPTRRPRARAGGGRPSQVCANHVVQAFADPASPGKADIESATEPAPRMPEKLHINAQSNSPRPYNPIRMESKIHRQFPRFVGRRSHQPQCVFASRRGDWGVMVRAAFYNRAFIDRLHPGMAVGHALHVPSGEVRPIHKAALRYRGTRTPTACCASSCPMAWTLRYFHTIQLDDIAKLRNGRPRQAPGCDPPSQCLEYFRYLSLPIFSGHMKRNALEIRVPHRSIH